MRTDLTSYWKTSSWKNQYKKKKQYLLTIPLKNHALGAAVVSGNSCSPLMYIDTHAICDYWYNIQNKKLQNNSTFVKSLMTPCYQGWKIY
jgi:hypothetical protein